MEEAQAMPNRKFLLSGIAATALLCACNTADLKTARRAQAEGDLETARANYTELAKYGIPEAQTELAMMTLQGKPSRAQAEEAAAMLKTASAGNAQLSMKLGDLYAEGEKVPRDLNLAYSFYNQAFELGATKAAYKIGALLADVPAKNESAKQWLLKALNLGETKSALKLGRLYEKGNIRDRSQAKALGYYIYAQSQGVDVRDSITKLKAKTSAADIQAGEMFAKQLSSGVFPPAN